MPGNPAAEQLLVAAHRRPTACHGMMLMPRPWRTIAFDDLDVLGLHHDVRVSTPLARAKNSSTSRRVIDPASKRTNGCLFKSAGTI